MKGNHSEVQQPMPSLIKSLEMNEEFTNKRSEEEEESVVKEMRR